MGQNLPTLGFGVGGGGPERSAAPKQNGLMVACCQGFVDIVPLLQHCPYVDVNQQDKEGNTALMMAAQAGGHRSPQVGWGVIAKPRRGRQGSLINHKKAVSLLPRAHHHR